MLVWNGARLALALALCAGCAPAAPSAGSPAGSSAESPAAADVAAFRELVYPPVELARAEHLVTLRCMRARGLRYPATGPRPEPASPTLLRTPPPLTPARARSTGYGAVISRSPGAGDDPVRRYLAGLDAAGAARFHRALLDESGGRASVVLAGVRLAAPRRGCRAEARVRTYGSLERFLTVTYLPQIAQREVGKVESDHEVLAAMMRYGRCMSANGYRVRTSTEAAELAATYYAGVRPGAARQREIALAVIDATCQERVGLFPAYRAAVNRVARRWIESHRADVRAVAAGARAAIENARGILRDEDRVGG